MLRVPDLIPNALKMATRICGDFQMGEDAVQDALIRLAKHGDGFRGEAELSTYFGRIVINSCHDQIAKAAKQPSDENHSLAELPCPADNDPAEQNDQAERIQNIRKAVEQLPPRQRDVLVLRTWDQKTPAEISQLLAISVQNVYAQLTLARNRLREILAIETSSETANKP
jgi:RNA polymerase sigma-70 factor (ECF subfamily)